MAHEVEAVQDPHKNPDGRVVGERVHRGTSEIHQMACKPWLAGDRGDTVYGMTTKDRLHQVVDGLSEQEAADALDYFVSRSRDPLARRLDAAPLDDEPLNGRGARVAARGPRGLRRRPRGLDGRPPPGTARLSRRPWRVDFARRAERDMQQLDPPVQRRVFAALDRLPAAGDPSLDVLEPRPGDVAAARGGLARPVRARRGDPGYRRCPGAAARAGVRPLTLR